MIQTAPDLVELGEAARDILATADRERRAVTEAEKRRFDALLDSIDQARQAAGQGPITRPDANLRSFDRWIDEPAEQRRTGHDALPKPPGMPERRDTPGTIGGRCLSPEESLANYMAEERRSRGEAVEVADLSIGDFIKHQITGNHLDRDQERRSQLIADSNAGGWTVHSAMAERFIDQVRNNLALSSLGYMTVPMPAPDYHFPRLDSDPTAYWRQEGVGITKSTLTFGRQTARANSLTCLVTATNELAQDSPQFVSRVQGIMAQTLALALDLAALNGSGAAAEPLGIRNYGGANQNDLSGAAWSYDDFLTSLGDLWSNNQMPNGYIVSPRTAEEASKKKTGDGEWLQEPAELANLTRVVTNQVSETLGASSNLTYAVIGDFRQLMLCTRLSVRLSIHESGTVGSEDLTSENKIAIRGVLRADWLPMYENAFSVIDNIAAA